MSAAQANPTPTPPVPIHPSAERQAVAAPIAAPAPARNKRGLRRALMLGGIVIVLGGTTVAYLNGGRYVGTDDAYVKAAQLTVTTDVSGMVKSVEAHEGQRVAAGDVLFRLDPEPFEIALANAKATELQAEMTVRSLKADYRKGDPADRRATSDGRRRQDHARSIRVAGEAGVDCANAMGPATGDVSVGIGDVEFARPGGRRDARAPQR